MPDLDVFKYLPTASFRGISFPIRSRDRCDHEKDTVQHGLQYRHQKLVETTGSGNLTFGYTIPFRQGIAKGGYTNLFTTTYKEFWLAYLNDDPGTLVDPIRGVYQVITVSWSEQVDVNQRDGLDVRIAFIEPGDISEDAETGAIETIASAYSAAGTLDSDIERQEWEQEESPPAATDPLAAIAGVGEQLENNQSKINAALHSFAYRCERIEQAFVRLENPRKASDPVRGARRLRLASHKLRERGQNPGRTVRKIETRTNKTISGLAKERNMMVQDLLTLNPDLRKLSIIPAGTTVRFYKQ